MDPGSDAAQDGPAAITHLLLDAGDSVLQMLLKAVVVIAVLLLARLVLHRLIKGVADKIATHTSSGRWDVGLTERRKQRPGPSPRCCRTSPRPPWP